MRGRPSAAATCTPTTVLTSLVVRVHTGDINDELQTTAQASKVTLIGEPKVDVALLKLGLHREADRRCRPMRGDVRLVDAGRDARKPPKYTVQRILELIM